MLIIRGLIAAALVVAAAAGCASPYDYRNTAYNPGYYYRTSAPGPYYHQNSYYPGSYYPGGYYYPRGYVGIVAFP